MLDKNGSQIKKSDVVKIEGGYFKADNGIFKVEHAPGDENWCGSDYCLYRMNKNGTVSESKYKTAFWPLMITVSSYEKRCEARQHNKDNATIEIMQSYEIRVA